SGLDGQAKPTAGRHLLSVFDQTPDKCACDFTVDENRQSELPTGLDAVQLEDRPLGIGNTLAQLPDMRDELRGEFVDVGMAPSLGQLDGREFSPGSVDFNTRALDSQQAPEEFADRCL